MTSQTWPSILGQLITGDDLSIADSAWAMGQIMSGDTTGAQFGAFVAALRAKGEAPAEVEGFVNEMLDRSVLVKVDGAVLDVVGTGGDLAETVNISTMSAIVAAAAGARVVKHGNRAASSKCGSADLLAELGVATSLAADGVSACFDEIGIAFCFAPVFHPALRHAGPYRAELKIPTVFNILGPLSNPARPNAMLVGAAHLKLAPVMAQVLADRDTSALVVRGLDGLDEVTIFDDTQVWDVSGRRTEVVEDVIRLEGLRIDAAETGALKGGDASVNAQILHAVFDGQTDGAVQSIRDAIAVNAAAALVAWDSIDAAPSAENLTDRIHARLPSVYEVIDDGRAAALLDRWIQVSTKLAG